MKQMKNFVLGLLGLVLAITLIAPVSAELSAQLPTTSMTIESDEPTIMFTFNTYFANVGEYSTTVTATQGTNTATVSMLVGDTQSTSTAIFTTASLGLAKVGAPYPITLTASQSDTTMLNYDVNVTVLSATINWDYPSLIKDVDFDDSEVAPGDNLIVAVDFENNGLQDFHDVEVRAAAYEVLSDGTRGDRLGDRITEDLATTFSDEETDTITFVIPVPLDAEEGDYVFRLEVTGDEGNLAESNEPFDVTRDEHSLFIDSVSFDNQVSAGTTFDVAVTVENNGQTDEDNVRVSASIAGVGLSQTSQYFTIEEDEKITRYYTFALPSTMSAGDYFVNVRAWNNDAEATDTLELAVVGGAAGVTGAATGGVTVTADAAVRAISATTGGVYRLNIVNDGNTARTFNIAIAGTEGWADYSVNPSVINVAPSATGQATVFVSPLAGATGTHAFTAYVQENGAVVNSAALTAQISGSASQTVDDSVTLSVTVFIVAVIVLFAMWIWRREPETGRGRRTTTRKRVYY